MISFNGWLLERRYQNNGYNNNNSSSSSVVNVMDGADSIVSSAASEASVSHKEAERRRRQRINSHLSTLRTLLPSTAKTDKATLLADVVQHVEELKRRVDELARQDGGSWPFPGELDEANLSCQGGGEGRLMKATLCCEDRPGLNRDLAQAIRAVRVRAVKAEMVTVGGRTKSVVLMKWTGGGGHGWEEEVAALKAALRAVVENRVSGSLGKRARFYGSVYEDDHS